jgi:hypothetical protein
MDFVQLASTLPGFTTGVRAGRHFHINGGKDASLGMFNVLLGVALTPVASSKAGGFHVLPGSHQKVAAEFGRQPEEPRPHWGNLKLECERRLLPGAASAQSNRFAAATSAMVVSGVGLQSREAHSWRSHTT